MHAKSIAQPVGADVDQELELVNYGAGYAWLRPEEPRYILTDRGRRALAVARFLDRSPTVAEVFGLTPARRGAA
jgi:hypothetical protein